MDVVPPVLIEKFRKGAEEVLKTKDAVSALAAALAVISGCTKVSQRSLMTSREVRYFIIIIVLIPYSILIRF